MRRGDVWRYEPVVPRPGQALLQLIVSADALNAGDVPVLLAVQVVESVSR